MPAFLTRQQRSTPRDPDRFPTTQLAVLALVRLAEPIALTSIFPYAIKLVQDFHVGTADNAAFLAGILVSAFSLAEALTGMYWGGLSDRLGRKPVLLFGCLGTLISMLVVGFSVNYWMALVGRALGGMLNGNIGVIQTMVGELVHRPEHEPRAYAIMPFVWSVGTIAGPALGGFFAEPAYNYPDTFSHQGIFGKFPFLLPNLICAGLLALSMVAGYFMLEETHPDMQPWSKPSDLDTSTAETPLVPAGGAIAHAAADLRNESYGTFDQVESHSTEEWTVKANGKSLSVPSDPIVLSEKVFTKRVIMLITALGIFTYHCMTYDHLLPIFLQDKDDRSVSAFSAFVIGGDINGHLGLTVQQCGIIMSVNGLIALFIQAVIFPFMAQWMGVWRLFIVVTIGHPIAYFIVPYLLLLPESSLYYGIYACLVVRNFFSILQYPLLLILIKEAAPSPTHLGRINGLAASVGAGARTAASPVAGLLWDVGRRIEFTPLAWWSSALIALVGAMQVPFISQRKRTTTTVRPAQCKFGPQEGRERRDSVVHITVQEIRAQLREDA